MINRNGVSPAAITACWIVGVGMFAVLRSMGFVTLSFALEHAFCVLAYLMGLVSCWRVAGTYPRGSPTRLGWLALGASCILSVFRHLALNPVFENLLGSRDRVYLLSQAFQMPALLLVLSGMLAIWWGLYRLGLGFRLRWLECAAVVLAATLVAWIFRDSLSHANSGHGVTAVLQTVSLSLLIGIGGVGLLLHGLSNQMGGGRLAVVMRCFAAYGLTRSILTLLQSNSESYSLLWRMFFFSAPWMFAFGASYSSWLTDTVKRSISRQSYSKGWYEA
jgi:hypothetical protein